MRNRIFKLLAVACVVAMCATTGHAQGEAASDGYTLIGRVGYSVGGTTPVGLPASIRKINHFEPRANISVAVDAYRHFGGRWGAQAAVHFENKGMRTDARVKGYSMEMRQGGESISGDFTGCVVTEVDQWMVTVPVMAAADFRKVRVHAGPYVSCVVNGKFSGYAYDGYLRQGGPTGPKVLIGSDRENRGDYDFSDDLRNWQFGLIAGADWQFFSRLGAYIDLSWGLTGVFKEDFKTIEQSMFPIYGTVGFFYRLK